MAEIQIPFPLKDIPVKPEMTGRLKIDAVMIQTLASLCGWDGEARRLLTCSLSGSLQVTSPPVKAVINKATSDPNEHITFSDIPTTEVMILARHTNTGDVWVNTGAAAGVDTGWPLAAGDSLKVSVNNLQDLRLIVVTSGDKVIIVYTV